MKLLLLAALLAVPALLRAGAPEMPSNAQMLSLSCMEALVAIDEQRLSGVFSFVAEKDSPAAFADLLAHNKKALKKYVAKMQKDKQVAGGVSTWDRDALSYAMGILASPLGNGLDQPDAKLSAEIQGLVSGQILSLEQISAARMGAKR